MNQLLFLFLGAALLQAQAPAPQPAAEGRLGGGYKTAKWGMSLAQVKSLLPGRLEYETRQPKAEKTLILSLGDGRKLTCLFENDQFYQAIYQPVAADNDQQASDAVLEGLQKKYGPGKDEEGFTDKEGRSLKLVTWNDGISKIEFRMRDPKAPEKSLDRKTPLFPSSTATVLYSSISISSRRSLRQEEDRKRQEEQKRQQKVNDIQGDL